MRRIVIRVICFVLLIPILGFCLLFGSAYVYGRIMYAEKRSTVVSILDAHENDLLEIVKDNTTDTKKVDLSKLIPGLVQTHPKEISIPEQLGFERLIKAENNLFFQLPYAGKPGSWVPCGLLYGNDLSAIEPWKKSSSIRGDWYFYWEP